MTSVAQDRPSRIFQSRTVGVIARLFVFYVSRAAQARLEYDPADPMQNGPKPKSVASPRGPESSGAVG